MAETDLQRYRRSVHALLDREVAELEQMRATFVVIGGKPTDAMASVCLWTRERVELLRENIRMLDHFPSQEHTPR